jgi:hypothetical protein
MIDRKIYKPTCHNRPCYLECKGDLPQKVKGKTLLPGKRYCAGDKRIKAFRAGDPKVQAPSWCPLRKTPPVLRIYCFKNSFSRMVHEMLRRDGKVSYPNDTDYAMRYEGTIDLTASQFRRELRERSAHEILGAAVHMEEVVEIDDGLEPYCFYFSEKRYMPYVIYFRGERARENKLETFGDGTDGE